MRKEEKLEIYIDMDGVLCNTDKYVAEHMLRTKGIKYDWKTNKSWWWSEWLSRKEAEELILSENFFYNLEPMEDAIEVLNKLHEEGHKIYFLSTPEYNKYCAYEKNQWLIENIDFYNEKEHLILTGNKKLLDGENRLLLDDSPNNLKWDKGINVCFDHSYNREFNGLRVNNFCDFYHLIQLMERGE